jgi:hypothetical protein
MGNQSSKVLLDKIKINSNIIKLNRILEIPYTFKDYNI